MLCYPSLLHHAIITSSRALRLVREVRSMHTQRPDVAQHRRDANSSPGCAGSLSSLRSFSLRPGLLPAFSRAIYPAHCHSFSMHWERYLPFSNGSSPSRPVHLNRQRPRPLRHTLSSMFLPVDPYHHRRPTKVGEAQRDLSETSPCGNGRTPTNSRVSVSCATPKQRCKRITRRVTSTSLRCEMAWDGA